MKANQEEDPYINTIPYTSFEAIIQDIPHALLEKKKNLEAIDMRIQGGFCCYTALVYFELVVNIVQLIRGYKSELNKNNYTPEMANCLIMVAACALAISAKFNLNAKKQFISAILFTMAIFINISLTLYFLFADGDGIHEIRIFFEDASFYKNGQSLRSNVQQFLSLTFIPLQMLIGLYLICHSRLLFKLMFERETIISEFKLRHMKTVPEF